MLTATKRAADYYRTTLANTTVTPTSDWLWATYADGLQTLYRQAGDALYLSDGLSWGRSNGWQLQGTLDPDNIKAGKTYYDLNAIDPTASLTAIDARMATDLTTLPLSQYYWIDALFMGLPNFTRWATRTGNPAYLDKMDALYAWTHDLGATSSVCNGQSKPQAGLFDAAQGLWYRDCRYVGMKDANGQPVFWARGNGWVIAAMAEVLQSLPVGSPHASRYADMLRTMAAKLVTLQGADGFWRTSLLNPALFPQPETSGTALITYALAYGIKAGLLDAATYRPAVAKAWQGLSTIASATQRVRHRLPDNGRRARHSVHRTGAADAAIRDLVRHGQHRFPAILRRRVPAGRQPGGRVDPGRVDRAGCGRDRAAGRERGRPGERR